MKRTKLGKRDALLCSNIARAVRGGEHDDEACDVVDISTADPQVGFSILENLEVELKGIDQDAHYVILFTYLSYLVEAYNIENLSPAYGWIFSCMKTRYLPLIDILSSFVPEAMCRDEALREQIFDLYMRLPLPLSDKAANLPKAIMQNYADARSRDFFTSLAPYLRESETKTVAIDLLCYVVHGKGPRIHEISQTPSMDALIHFLKTEQDEFLISIGCYCLAGLMPRILPVLAGILHDMCVIVRRCLCWNLHCGSENHPPIVQSEEPSADCETRVARAEMDDTMYDDEEFDEMWHRCWATPLTVTNAPPYVLRNAVRALFYNLYGMFPSNFLTFLREECGKSKYLFDIIKPLIHNLALNPLILLEDENREMSAQRWIKVSQEEIVSRCMVRKITKPETQESSLHARKESLSQDPPFLDFSLLAENIPKHFKPATPSDSSPSLSTTSIGVRNAISSPAAPTVPSSPLKVKTMSNLSKSDRISLDSSNVNHFGPRDMRTENSMKLSTPRFQKFCGGDLLKLQQILEQNLYEEAPAEGRWLDNSMEDLQKLFDCENAAMLQKEVMLLRNEVLFERYLRHEYLNRFATSRKQEMQAIAVREDREALYAKIRNQHEARKKSFLQNVQYRKENEEWRLEMLKYNHELEESVQKYRYRHMEMHQNVHLLRAEIAKTKEENELYKAQNAERENLIFTYEAHLIEMGSRIEKEEEYRQKMNEMQKEWESCERTFDGSSQLQSQLDELSNQLKHRDELCLAQQSDLDEEKRKTAQLAGEVEAQKGEIGQLKKEVAMWKQSCEMQKDILTRTAKKQQEQMTAVEDKYKNTRKINIFLRNELGKLQAALEVEKAKTSTTPLMKTPTDLEEELAS